MVILKVGTLIWKVYDSKLVYMLFFDWHLSFPLKHKKITLFKTSEERELECQEQK